MADAAFSIREYAASMLAAEEWRLLRIEDLPPLRAPRYRWWAYELASTVAATAAEASPRRAPGQTRPPNKRSISDLFPAAPPLAVVVAGCKEQTEVDGDQVLCAIARRAKEEKKRKRKLQDEEEGQKEETAAVDAAPESSGGREPEGNFPARKDFRRCSFSGRRRSSPRRGAYGDFVNFRMICRLSLSEVLIKMSESAGYAAGPGSLSEIEPYAVGCSGAGCFLPNDQERPWETMEEAQATGTWAITSSRTHPNLHFSEWRCYAYAIRGRQFVAGQETAWEAKEEAAATRVWEEEEGKTRFRRNSNFTNQETAWEAEK